MFDEYTDLVAVFTHYFVYTYCMVLLSGIKNTQSLYTVQNMQGFFLLRGIVSVSGRILNYSKIMPDIVVIRIKPSESMFKDEDVCCPGSPQNLQ